MQKLGHILVQLGKRSVLKAKHLYYFEALTSQRKIAHRLANNDQFVQLKLKSHHDVIYC
jgi:hypothetical protein